MFGRAQSPFVQRALGLDWNARQVVYEAPAGASIADARPVLPAYEVVRLLKRLARAAAAIHEVGGAHGAISERTVVLDDGAAPTVMAAGLGAVLDGVSPANDVAQIIALVATIAECEPSFEALVKDVVDEAGAKLPTYPKPIDGESLYAAADIIDIAVLGALGSR